MTITAEKSRFVVHIKPKPASGNLPWSLWSAPFRELVAEALSVSRKVAAMQKPGAQKLSGEAFLRETLAIQKGATVARVKQLRKKLPTLTNAQGAVRKMMKELKGPNLRTPPSAQRWEERHRAMFLAPRTTEVLAELTAAGNFTALELFAVAVQMVAEQDGQAFGAVDTSQGDLDADIGRAIERRDALFARIGNEWTAGDVDVGHYDRGHTTHATFKGTSVPIAPPATAGQRLTQSLFNGAKLVEALKAASPRAK